MDGACWRHETKSMTFIDIYIQDICGENHLPCDNWLQRPRGAYRWRETPVAASWGKAAQTDPRRAAEMGQLGFSILKRAKLEKLFNKEAMLSSLRPTKTWTKLTGRT